MELKVQNVFKSFGEKEVLRDISISAHSGTALGLLGRNGAGKTTTIRIIMGVFLPTRVKCLLTENKSTEIISVSAICPKKEDCIPNSKYATKWCIWHSSGECPRKMLRKPVTSGLKECP